MKPGVRAGALALVLLTVLTAGPLLLAQDQGAVPGADDGPVDSQLGVHGSTFTAAGFPARFALTRPLDADPAREAVVIASPRVGYSPEEVNALLSFLRAGGRVVIADTGGASGELLDRLGAGVALVPGRVYSPAFNETPSRIVGLSTGAIPGLPPEVVLTRPALVAGGAPVIDAPALSWVDANGNGLPDLDESLGPGLSFAARTDVGAGTLVVVGHPDAVDASKLPVLAGALLSWASGDGERVLLFDASHHPRADPLGLNALLAGRSSSVTTTGMLMFTLVLGAAVVLAPRVRRATRRPSRPTRRDVPPALLRELLEELDSR